MYADKVSEAMDYAIKETYRRREIQEKYNIDHNITPHTIIKQIRDVIKINKKLIENKKISKDEVKKTLSQLELEMKDAAKALDFERAAQIRDLIIEIKGK